MIEFFANRSDKLLVLDIENPDAANPLARFLGCDADLETEVLHQQREGSITGLLLRAIGSTHSPENSAIDTLWSVEPIHAVRPWTRVVPTRH